MMNKKCRVVNYILGLWIGIILTSQTVYADENDVIEDKTIVVSLGDSYSSGEGIEPFYGQYKDNDAERKEKEDVAQKIKNEDWLAHRSMKCWSGRLNVPGVNGSMSNHKDDNWYFAASSGAVTDNLKKKQDKPYKKGKYEGVEYIPEQLSVFDKIDDDVDYVTLTFGGNDVGFKNIIMAAVIDHWLAVPYINPAKLSDDLNKTWANFDATGEKIKNAYIDIAKEAGDDAEILVAGYPQLLDENIHVGVYWKSQAEEINSNVSRFNKALSEIVDCCRESGIKIRFISVEEEFAGHEAYAKDSYINGIELTHEEDLVDLQVMPPVSAYSIHPNDNGAAAYASCVQKEIDKIEIQKAMDKAKKDLNDNPLATDDELNASAKQYNGLGITPEDIVMKMYAALKKGDYEKAASCLDPTIEKQIGFLGGIVSKVAEALTGEYMSWGQLLLEAAGATDVDVIECYSYNFVMDTNLSFFKDWIPVIPGINELLCSDAEVYVKYRYKYNNEYRTQEERYHMRRCGFDGWRIMLD